MILLLGWTLKTSLIAAIAFAACFFGRRWSAAIRHLVWAAAFSTIILLPLCSLLIPSSFQSNLPAPITRVLTPQQYDFDPIGSADSFAVRPTSAIVPLSWPALIWLVGCLASATVLVVGSAQLAWTAQVSPNFLDARWLRASDDLSRAFGLKRPVRLLQGSDASMPVTWGLLRPCILLPGNALDWPDQRIRVVLSHEFAHIHRCDWPVQMLAEFVRLIYWFNPLLWIACNRLRQEAERACDDAALSQGIDGTEYAAHLLDVARMLKTSRRAWSLALAMARPSNLERRFIAMVNPTLDRRTVSPRTLIVTALSALSILLPLAALRAHIVQAPARFSGSVYDSKGTAIPNATIILTRVDDGTQMKTTSSRAGTFEFSQLAAGHYSVDIRRTGFADLHINDVDREAPQNAPLNAMLPAQSNSPRATPQRGERGGGPVSDSTHEYRIGNVQITGATVLSEAEIRSVLGLVPNETFDESRLRNALEELKRIYGSRGYINFVPVPLLDLDKQKQIANLTINIDEDQQFILNRIRFIGNTTTRDEVIRRELGVKENEVFNTSAWYLSLSRLNQVGYFEEIKMEDAAIKPYLNKPKVDIELRLREKGRN